MAFSRSCKLNTFGISGVCLLLLGSFMLGFWNRIFESIFNKQMALTNTSKSYDLWKKTPIPMYLEFYFFNWTNPMEPKRAGYKPILKELGPYVYREQREKVILKWNEGNETVTFLQNRTWIYEPSLSNGSLDDDLITLNIPAITAAFAVRNELPFIKTMLNDAMNLLDTRVYVKRKVREFIFEGYGDPLLDLAQILPPGFAPITIPFDKFGWFYTRNGSAEYDGVFNMKTGVDDIQNLGVAGAWDYTNQTSYYESNCGVVRGSAGEFFPPKRDKTKISLFATDICRSVDLTYEEENEVDGIKSYRFVGDENLFANQTLIPDNWCWCPSGPCPPHGTLDVSSCKWGAPAFISFPHFYLADPYYKEAVTGMNPQTSKHQMFIDLEPRTGIPLQVSAAFQINILLQPMDEFTILRGVPTIYFPALWFVEKARIDDEIRPQLKLLVAIPTVGTVIFSIMIGAGIIVLVAWVVLLKRKRNAQFATQLN